MDITILGIESSCDDTSAAVIRNTTLLSNVIASQEVHRKYGGVIPELASRAHYELCNQMACFIVNVLTGISETTLEKFHKARRLNLIEKHQVAELVEWFG